MRPVRPGLSSRACRSALPRFEPRHRSRPAWPAPVSRRYASPLRALDSAPVVSRRDYRSDPQPPKTAALDRLPGVSTVAAHWEENAECAWPLRAAATPKTASTEAPKKEF